MYMYHLINEQSWLLLIPYSQKYWQELTLVAGSQIQPLQKGFKYASKVHAHNILCVEILADFYLAVAWVDCQTAKFNSPPYLLFSICTICKFSYSLQCLYCERTFCDHPTLKAHMRKKQHKKISPKNKVYNRFYIINYLELGKSWEEVQFKDDWNIISTEEK